MRALLLAGLVVLGEVCIPARAYARGERIEVIPFGGAQIGGSFRDQVTGDTLKIDESPAWGLAVDIAWERNTELEMFYARQPTELRREGAGGGVPLLDLTVEYLQIGGTYLFEKSGRVQPYFAATVGATRFTPGAAFAADTRFSFTAGGGAKVPLTRRLSLRFDGRAYVTLIDSNSSVFCNIPGQCEIAFRGDTLVQWDASLGLILAF